MRLIEVEVFLQSVRCVEAIIQGRHLMSLPEIPNPKYIIGIWALISLVIPERRNAYA